MCRHSAIQSHVRKQFDNYNIVRTLHGTVTWRQRSLLHHVLPILLRIPMLKRLCDKYIRLVFANRESILQPPACYFEKPTGDRRSSHRTSIKRGLSSNGIGWPYKHYSIVFPSRMNATAEKFQNHGCIFGHHEAEDILSLCRKVPHRAVLQNQSYIP